eukprot:sb/3468014/
MNVIQFLLVFEFIVGTSCRSTEHGSTEELFKELEYENLEHLEGKDLVDNKIKFHLYWNRKWGYSQQDYYYIEQYRPTGRCSFTKEGFLDCSKLRPSDEEVVIVKKDVSLITKESFPENNGVKKLSLVSINSLTEIRHDAFDRLKNLEILVITRTNLLKVPPIVTSLPRLRFIDLSENKLYSIHADHFKECPNLEVLNLGGNVLEHLSHQAFSGTKLKLLTLNHNKLKSVPQFPDLSDTLIYLGLEHNEIGTLPKYAFEKLPPNYVDLQSPLGHWV